MPAIRPRDIPQAKKDYIPEEVLAVFNEMIIKNIHGKRASFKRKDVVAKIAELMGVTADHVYQNNWLDVGQIYRDEGWKFELDAPGYNESYDAYYVFSH